MAAASAGDDGDLWLGGIRAKVDNLVLGIEGGGRVGLSDRFEGRENEVRGVVDEVFCCIYCKSRLLALSRSMTYKTC